MTPNHSEKDMPSQTPREKVVQKGNNCCERCRKLEKILEGGGTFWICSDVACECHKALASSTKFCPKCRAHGTWEGEHDCPPWMLSLVKNHQQDMKDSLTPREDWETEEPWISIEGILWDLSNQASGMHYGTALQEIKKHLDAHIHHVESSAREQGRKEEKERLLKTLYNLDRDPQELANQNAVRESELETPHRALDLEIIKEVLDNPFPVYPNALHPTHNEDKK